MIFKGLSSEKSTLSNDFIEQSAKKIAEIIFNEKIGVIIDSKIFISRYMLSCLLVFIFLIE